MQTFFSEIDRYYFSVAGTKMQDIGSRAEGRKGIEAAEERGNDFALMTFCSGARDGPRLPLAVA